MKVLAFEPKKPPYVKEIDGSLESLQNEVGGTIQAIYPFEEEVAIVCNDEGKILGLEPNRFLADENGVIYDYICGNFILVALGDEDFDSLSDNLINKFMNDERLSLLVR